MDLQVWVLAGAWGDQASSPHAPGSGGLFRHTQELKCNVCLSLQGGLLSDAMPRDMSELVSLDQWHPLIIYSTLPQST